MVLIKDLKTKVILAVLWLGGLWLLSEAISRISIASYLLSVSLALLLVKKAKAMVVVVIVSVFVFGFSSGLAARYGRMIEVIKRWSQSQKILMVPEFSVYAQGNTTPTLRPTRAVPTPTPIPVFEDRSSSIRLKVEWPRAIRAFTKNPLLGNGYSSITLATDNDYLRALGEVGILGSVAFGLIFLRILEQIIRRLRWGLSGLSGIEKAFVAGVIGSLPAVLLNAVFIDVFEASKFAIIFWLVMGLFIGFVRERSYVE
jgi:hypothetical protein